MIISLPRPSTHSLYHAVVMLKLRFNPSFYFFFFFPPQDAKIRLYSIQGNTLKAEGQVLETKGSITDMAYSNDGAYLGVIDDKKVATVFTVADGYSVNIFLFHSSTLGIIQDPLSGGFVKRESLCVIYNYFSPFFVQVKNEFYGHHAKPVTLAWSPDNEHFATGGMDMMVYVWTISDADKRIKLPGKPYKGHTRIHSFLEVV